MYHQLRTSHWTGSRKQPFLRTACGTMTTGSMQCEIIVCRDFRKLPMQTHHPRRQRSRPLLSCANHFQALGWRDRAWQSREARTRSGSRWPTCPAKIAFVERQRPADPTPYSADDPIWRGLVRIPLVTTALSVPLSLTLKKGLGWGLTQASPRRQLSLVQTAGASSPLADVVAVWMHHLQRVVAVPISVVAVPAYCLRRPVCLHLWQTRGNASLSGQTSALQQAHIQVLRLLTFPTTPPRAAVLPVHRVPHLCGQTLARQMLQLTVQMEAPAAARAQVAVAYPAHPAYPAHTAHPAHPVSQPVAAAIYLLP